MTAIEVEPSERFRLHGADPADIMAAQDEAAARVARLVASLRAPWQRDALCREFELALWFPSSGQSNQPALDICGRCVVRVECLNEALLDADLDFGIRGGMTANARKAARHARGITPTFRTPPPRTCVPRCKCDQCRADRAESMRRWRHNRERTS